ncbi:AAA family ATPase [Escherichia coli]|nr:AAA family ATPase [Escherichia coli]
MTDMNMIPQNIEAEQSVLGGMMLDSGSDRCQTAMSMLKPESFYIRPHQVIFAEMRELVANQKPIDLITLIESLESKGLGEQAGGFAYMAEISKNTPSAANIVHYAMLVREKAMERYGIDKLTSATELLYSRNGMTTSQKFDAIQTLFTDIADYAKTGNRRGLREFSEVMGDWVDEVEARWSDSDATRGLSTGIGSLDDLLQPKGLVKGALMVIGARPKMGKTTLYSQLAVNCAEVEQLPALMFSLEMPDKQIVERMIGQVSRVNTDVFYGDRYDDAQVAMAFAAGGRLAQTGNLYVDDTPGITLAHIVAESRRIKRERGAVGMVLVDYSMNRITEGKKYCYRYHDGNNSEGRPIVTLWKRVIIRETEKTFWHVEDMPYMTNEQLIKYRTGGQPANQKYHVKRCLKGADRSSYHYTKEEALQAFVRRKTHQISKIQLAEETARLCLAGLREAGIITEGYRCKVEKLPDSDIFLAANQPGPIASGYSWGEY